MSELSDEQIQRQDSVDNAIYRLIQVLNPTDTIIAWDIEMIGDVRDVMREWFVDKRNITSEQAFYPSVNE